MDTLPNYDDTSATAPRCSRRVEEQRRHYKWMRDEYGKGTGGLWRRPLERLWLMTTILAYDPLPLKEICGILDISVESGRRYLHVLRRTGWPVVMLRRSHGAVFWTSTRRFEDCELEEKIAMLQEDEAENQRGNLWSF